MQVHWQDKFRQFRDRLQPVDYFPKSQAHLPAEQRDQYKAFELWDTLQGEVNGKKVRLKYRVIFVWSEAKARQDAETRTRHLDTIREEFEKVQKNLNKYKLKTREAIVDRLERAKQKYREGSLFQYTLKKRGLYRLTWTIDEQQLERWRELDGVYLLKTSMPKTQHPIDKVLKKYREQGTVERRIQYVKGPLAVMPMFLEKPERMAGLLCIVVWALMVLTLMEREVRRNLDGQPLYGLYPENRPSPAPTGKAILECFSTVSIVIIKHRGTTNRRLGELDPIQQKLLRLMGIPPGALQTFKRRCGT
jgi:transposase